MNNNAKINLKKNITLAARPGILAFIFGVVIFGMSALEEFISASSNSVSVTADSHLQQAMEALKSADSADRESRQLIVEANHTRKEIKKIRAALRRPDHSDSGELTRRATALTEQLTQLQARGARLRADSLEQKARALHHFEQGFYAKWKPWVNCREPLSMAYSSAPNMAHNTQVRSTHPSMLNKMGTAMDSIDRDTASDMSLLVPALAAQNAPSDLDIRALQLSRDERYLAHIEVQTSSASREHKNPALVPLNKMHQWRLLISDLAGNPARPANIAIEGHMPGHVHGLPSQPEVTKELAPGVYLVEGVKFQMKGWWVMQFHVTADGVDAKPDTLTFNLVL